MRNHDAVAFQILEHDTHVLLERSGSAFEPERYTVECCRRFFGDERSLIFGFEGEWYL